MVPTDSYLFRIKNVERLSMDVSSHDALVKLVEELNGALFGAVPLLDAKVCPPQTNSTETNDDSR